LLLITLLALFAYRDLRWWSTTLSRTAPAKPVMFVLKNFHLLVSLLCVLVASLSILKLMMSSRSSSSSSSSSLFFLRPAGVGTVPAVLSVLRLLVFC
jgi:hypothetical protein